MKLLVIATARTHRIAGAQPTELERSDAYRVYNQTYEDGLRFLSRSKSRRTS